MQTGETSWWKTLIGGIIFLIAGIVMVFFSISSINSYNEKNKKYIETTAKVVDYDYDDEGLQAIIVEYSVDRQTYRKKSNSYSSMPKSIGTEVSIKYNPNNPQDAIWTNDSTNIILPIISVVFTILGVIIVIVSFKDMKKNKEIIANAVEQSNGLYSNIPIDNQTSQPVNNQTLNTTDSTQQNNQN